MTSLVSSSTRRLALNCARTVAHRLSGDPVGVVEVSREIDDDPNRIVAPGSQTRGP